MSELKMEDITAPTSEAPVEETTKQDPLKTELEKVQKTEGKTEAEKAAFTLKKNADRLRELGGNPEEILGIKTVEESEEDDKPLTIGMLKKIQMESAQRSAIQMTEDIPNEAEKALVQYHLQNTIKPTGNPTEDFKNARAIVNSVKNTQIVEEIKRKPEAKTHSSSSGAPLKQVEDVELTPVEVQFMQQFGLTKEEVIKARG